MVTRKSSIAPLAALLCAVAPSLEALADTDAFEMGSYSNWLGGSQNRRTGLCRRDRHGGPRSRVHRRHE